jgi:hypothetical protein
VPTPADSLIVGLQEWYPSPTMNLVCNPMSRALMAAQLAVATLVLTAGCDGGGGDESSSTGSSTSDATDGTTVGETPTTTDETPTSSETGSSETGGEPLVDYMTQIQPIWDMRCVTGCHIESGIAQTDGPILTATASFADLVNAPSPTVADIDEVEPGDLDKSYLWHKLNGTQSNVGGLGLQMPQGGMLPPAELELVKLWIEQGANP